MPTRREFLANATSATVTLLLIPLVDCTSSTAPAPTVTTPTDAGAAPQQDAAVPGCNGVGEVSTTVPDPEAGNTLHNHTVCVLTSDLTNPPAGGVTYDTSIVLSHNHTITLTQAMLQAINAGMSVTVTTSDVAMHTHMFTIVMMVTPDAGTPSPSPTPSPTPTPTPTPGY